MLNKLLQSKFSLLLILILAFVVRLYRFDGPIADWHSWRQADTSAVSRNFIKLGFDVLHPRFDDLSNVPTTDRYLDNPNGYRFVEFPIYNIAQAGLFSLFGYFTIEEWGRLVTIFSSLGSIVFLYFLLRKYADNQVAILAAFFFAFLPFNIYYGRTILPDSVMVAAMLGAIYFFDRWIENAARLPIVSFNFLLTVLFTTSAILIKPYALFFSLPMFYIAWQHFGITLFKKWQLWFFGIISLLPFVFWRVWMIQYPEGIPSSDWLFNGGNIRFKGAFFYWLFADRLSRLILGYWGLFLFVLGIIVKRQNTNVDTKKRDGFPYSFLASSLLYVCVIARGNVQHDYYQILIIPSIAIFLALGSNLLLKGYGILHKKIAFVILLTSIIFMFSFSWYFVRDYFNINNPSIITAGQIVDKLTPQDAKVIASYEGDTSFLYQTKRQGWASFEKPLPQMVQMGAQYLILVNPKENDYHLAKEYTILASSPQYLLIDLAKKP